jgi:hypothetical protein
MSQPGLPKLTRNSQHEILIKKKVDFQKDLAKKIEVK